MLRCPNCSAPIGGKAKACEYCSAPLEGLEKHAEVEWPVRCPEAEALVAIDLRCPSGLPLDPVRGLLEVTFGSVVTDLGGYMALRTVERALQRLLPARIDDAYVIHKLRVTAFTPTWRSGPTERQRPLFQAKRTAPSSKPTRNEKHKDDGVREELVAPVARKRTRVDSGIDPAKLLLGVGLTLALAAVMGALIVIGVWISHHIVLTILLAMGLLAAGAVVWGTRRDREKKQKWEEHLAAKRAASGRVPLAAAAAPKVTPKAASASAKLTAPAPQVANTPAPTSAVERSEASEESPRASSDSSVSLSVPTLKKREQRERTH